MSGRRSNRFAPLLALLAALMQLWLGAVHGSMIGGLYCGDGNVGRSAALMAQLPPELRGLTADRSTSTSGVDCKLCAPLCSPALPPTAIALDLTWFTHTAAVVTPALLPPAPLHSLRPPVRAPPVQS